MERPIIFSCTRTLSTSFKSNSVRVTTRGFSSHPQSAPSRRPAKATSNPSVFRPSYRCLHATPRLARSHGSPPKSRDRGPKSDEDTQTDFANLDVLRHSAAPATGIDACTNDGFALNNQMRIGGCGVLLVGGEAFRWRPWVDGHRKEIAEGGRGDESMTGTLQNQKGQWDVKNDVWGILELVYPKPDLLIIGTGPHVLPIAPSVRKHLNDLGIRLEIQDTRNAAAQFNLLATERGVTQVAAALIPIGWKEKR